MGSPKRRSRDVPRDLSLDLHRRLIGVLGFFLPALLVVVAGLRPVEKLDPWELLRSLSHYYHTGAIGLFVGVLFALSLFLVSYGGYERVFEDGSSKRLLADRIVGTVGGIAALGVALLPTKAPDGVPDPFWWRRWMWVAHNASAVVLFACFIAFSVWLFRKSDVPREDRDAEKRWRDRVCLWCGIVMIACVLWALSSWFTGASIFWPETLATMAFAVSWLTKGKIHAPVIRFLRGGSGV